MDVRQSIQVLAIAIVCCLAACGPLAGAPQVPLPTDPFQPASVRGTIVDVEGSAVAGKRLALCRESEGSEGRVLVPVPQGSSTAAWMATTDEAGAFEMRPLVSLSASPPSPDRDQARYTLVITADASFAELPLSCGAYLLLGQAHIKECVPGEEGLGVEQTLWFTLERGAQVDLGQIAYVAWENAPCCTH